MVIAACGSGEPDVVLTSMRRAVHLRVRMVVPSLVTHQTGAVLPLREIARLAHDAGAFVLVNGAHSVGAIPVFMHEPGAGFYAPPGQKWLCGPEGTGGPCVAREAPASLEQTYIGGFGVDQHSFGADDVGFEPAPGAQRYEAGSPYRPDVVGSAAHLARAPGRRHPTHRRRTQPPLSGPGSGSARSRAADPRGRDAVGAGDGPAPGRGRGLRRLPQESMRGAPLHSREGRPSALLRLRQHHRRDRPHVGAATGVPAPMRCNRARPARASPRGSAHRRQGGQP